MYKSYSAVLGVKLPWSMSCFCKYIRMLRSSRAAMNQCLPPQVQEGSAAELWPRSRSEVCTGEIGDPVTK